MAGESARDAGHEQTEALIDEAIRAILNEATSSAEPSSAGSLLETAALASTLTSSGTSLLQQLLSADALASALAGALAPALAEQLAPRLMKYLEDAMASWPSGGEPIPAAVPADVQQAGEQAGPAADAGTVDVRFTLPAEVRAGTVALCGEFNDWSAQDILLERGDDGSWQATVALAPGRSYRYRYLIDGERWENAPNADSYVPNSYGTYDSVIVVD
jgi:Glycogen recognition site of AMP-activated protein kinase